MEHLKKSTRRSRTAVNVHNFFFGGHKQNANVIDDMNEAQQHLLPPKGSQDEWLDGWWETPCSTGS